jgi:hypothetical protein
MVCDELRATLLQSRRLEEGLVVITSGPFDDLSYTTFRPRYASGTIPAKAYEGLTHFLTARETRDVHLGSGKSPDDPAIEDCATEPSPAAVATLFPPPRSRGVLSRPVTTGPVAPKRFEDHLQDRALLLAEEKGFEPLVPFPVRRFSKPLPSTTRPLLPGASRRRAASSPRRWRALSAFSAICLATRPPRRRPAEARHGSARLSSATSRAPGARLRDPLGVTRSRCARA